MSRSIIFSLRVENEQADAGRDGRTCLARPNSQARTGTGKYKLHTFPVQLTTSRIDNLTELIHTLQEGSFVTYVKLTLLGKSFI